jgi:hypothetical protein
MMRRVRAYYGFAQPGRHRRRWFTRRPCMKNLHGIYVLTQGGAA